MEGSLLIGVFCLLIVACVVFDSCSLHAAQGAFHAMHEGVRIGFDPLFVRSLLVVVPEGEDEFAGFRGIGTRCSKNKSS